MKMWVWAVNWYFSYFRSAVPSASVPAVNDVAGRCNTANHRSFMVWWWVVLTSLRLKARLLSKTLAVSLLALQPFINFKVFYIWSGLVIQNCYLYSVSNNISYPEIWIAVSVTFNKTIECVYVCLCVFMCFMTWRPAPYQILRRFR